MTKFRIYSSIVTALVNAFPCYFNEYSRYAIKIYPAVNDLKIDLSTLQISVNELISLPPTHADQEEQIMEQVEQKIQPQTFSLANKFNLLNGIGYDFNHSKTSLKICTHGIISLIVIGVAVGIGAEIGPMVSKYNVEQSVTIRFVTVSMLYVLVIFIDKTLHYHKFKKDYLIPARKSFKHFTQTHE